jgi:hypothetical protein
MSDATANATATPEKGSPTTGPSIDNQPISEPPHMSSWLRFILMIYFVSIIIASIYFLILIWHPGLSEDFLKTTRQTSTTSGPGTNRTLTTIIQDQPIKTMNVSSLTSVMSADKKTKTTTQNVTVTPVAGQQFKLVPYPSYVLTNREIRLVIIATLFGVLGGAAQGISSLTSWLSRDKLYKGWGWWYFSRPYIGAAMALITYLVLRAGFISGSPTAINDFGVAAFSSLVGLMTVEITQKLRDVFDSFFGIKKDEGEKGEHPQKPGGAEAQKSATSGPVTG